MQQPIHHQQVVQRDQIGNQQQQHNMVQQQMMLCPVRLVYETPFIVQQGVTNEQPQNQNIFINPQNPPPWARPVQNQVIYVQQVQPNMMPIQQMDPNQIYLQQNLANYQQMITQQMLNQNTQEQRQIQMQMQIPNMMQNVQALAPNIQGMQSELPMGMISNYTIQQPNQEANVQSGTQNQMNLVPDPNNAARQIVSVQTTQTIHQNAQNQKAVELQRQTFYRNVVPQAQQQIIRPQMPIAMNQVQNMTSIQQIQQLANQNFTQNIRPAQSQIQQIVGNVHQNAVMMNAVTNMQSQTQERPNVNLANNTVTYSAVRNGQSYTFRAIQPKPPQYRNFAPMAQVARHNVPNNVSNMNMIKPNQIVQRPPPPITAAPAPVIPTQTYKQPEPPNNRKRKSESPDEIQKKVALGSTVYGSITVTPKAQDKFVNKNTSVSYDIAVEPSPAYIAQYKTEAPQTPVLQINPMDVHVQKIKEESVDHTKLPQSLPNISIPASSSKDVKDHLKATLLQAEKDRLARSTVFPQARGRLLSDKPVGNPLPAIIKMEDKPKQVPKESTDAFTQTVPKKAVERAPIVNPVKPEPIVPKIEKKPAPSVPQIDTKPQAEQPKMKLKDEPIVHDKNTVPNSPTVKLKAIVPTTEKPLTSIENNIKFEEKVLKTEEKASEKTVEKNEKSPVKPEKRTNEAKDKKEYKNISPKDMKGKEIHIVNGNIVKEDKDFVLTHVLDGYVIQESNVPFAIRKPLKEKTMAHHAKMETAKEEAKTEKDKANERVIKDNSKILDLSHLQLHDGKVEAKDTIHADENEEPSSYGNPFSNLKSAVVKSWTVDDLTSHLTKHEWEETANIFKEHEIDGESLFLVSKSQLEAIGVKETCADVIFEFISCKL